MRALRNESVIHVVFIEKLLRLDKTSWIHLFTNFVWHLLNGIDDVLEKNVMNSELIKFLTY